VAWFKGRDYKCCNIDLCIVIFVAISRLGDEFKCFLSSWVSSDAGIVVQFGNVAQHSWVRRS
jgi:hypothetical protein